MPQFTFEYTTYESIQYLPSHWSPLITVARQKAKEAYAPYSKFGVGAAILLQNGAMITGVNIENASYPVGICAERSALASLYSSHSGIQIEAFAISTYSDIHPAGSPAFPCGMCRQFIAESVAINQRTYPILLSAQQGEVIVIADALMLLPFHFGPQNLLQTKP